MGANALTYVAGYLLKKCMQNHQCYICFAFLVCDQLNDPAQLFSHFKAYNNNNSPFGSLIVPADEFVEYINNIELLFVETFSKSHKHNC